MENPENQISGKYMHQVKLFYNHCSGSRMYLIEFHLWFIIQNANFPDFALVLVLDSLRWLHFEILFVACICVV